MHSHTPNSNIPLLTAAFLASLTTGGPTYAFGLYGAALKTSLHLSQSQLDTLSSSNFCAGFFTWLPGLLVDRWGVRWSMMGGGVLGALFMTGYWLLATQFVAVPQVYLLPLLCALGCCAVGILQRLLCVAAP
jgi:MFS family permease